jgi:beta-xylosidase
MKKSEIKKITTVILLAIMTTLGTISLADNPIIQTIFTADPAPIVHDGTLYLYTGHDEDDASNNRYLMRDYRCFSTADMVNWTDHGAVLDIREVFDWSGGDANAAQCIFRNVKFFYYVSTGNAKGPGGDALGIAVSSSSTGPFKDALGHALVTNNHATYACRSWDDLDPTVFIDDDGRTFLYWGNNACYYAELNEEIIFKERYFVSTAERRHIRA